MPKNKGIIFLSKNNQGDLVLEIEPNNFSFRGFIKLSIKLFLTLLIKLTFPIFTFLNLLATRKKLVISSIGLGIGLGISVLITQRPDTLQAFPSVVADASPQITPGKVTIPSIDLSVAVDSRSVQNLLENANSDTLIHDERSAILGERGTVVIADVGISNKLENLEKVSIGDFLEVEGSNGATYKYVVTEIRDMQAEYLSNVVGLNQDVIILYKAKNILRTQLYMVIAAPVQ